MGFVDDFGKPQGDSARRRREHEEELARIRREGAAEVAGIYDELRVAREESAQRRQREWELTQAYETFLRDTGRTDVSFDDWRAGRYVHVVLTRW